MAIIYCKILQKRERKEMEKSGRENIQKYLWLLNLDMSSGAELKPSEKHSLLLLSHENFYTIATEHSGGGLCLCVTSWTMDMYTWNYHPWNQGAKQSRNYLYWMLPTWKASLCLVREPYEPITQAKLVMQPGSSMNQQYNSDMGPSLLQSPSLFPSPHNRYPQCLCMYHELCKIQFSLALISWRFDPIV